MIETTSNAPVAAQDTPATITTTMILNDLNNGIGRDDIKIKYGLETWEVTQIFQHPTLKGKKAKKVRKLSFEFVDDTVELIDPNQVDLEDAIGEEEEAPVEEEEENLEF